MKNNSVKTYYIYSYLLVAFLLTYLVLMAGFIFFFS